MPGYTADDGQGGGEHWLSTRLARRLCGQSAPNYPSILVPPVVPSCFHVVPSRVPDGSHRSANGVDTYIHYFYNSATLMLEGGADIRYIQAMLGHVSLNTTQIYTHVTISKLREVHV
jgi:integrase